jgi:signal transduction histidine kinase/ligand-binding sensor domain-containing protein
MSPVGCFSAVRWLAFGLVALWPVCSDATAEAVRIPPDYVVRNWTTADGLPENSVRSIVETPDGYLWMSTAYGLARFDGVRFENFDPANSPTLFSGDIFTLRTDPQGGIWMSTRRGVFRYHAGEFTHMPRPQDEVSSPLSNLINDAEGNVWMRAGTNLVCWSGQRLVISPMPPGPQKVRAIYAAAKSGFWLDAEDGLWRVRDGKAIRVVAGTVPDYLAFAPDDQVWGVRHDVELVHLKDREWELAKELPDRCATIWVAASGDIWLGAAADNHAYLWRQGELLELGSEHGLRGNRAISFTEDREGNVWLGMNGGGVYCFREKRLRIFNQRDGFGNTALTSALALPTGEIVVGNMGWNCYRLEGEHFVPIPHGASNETLRETTALAPAAEGGFWVGTFFGTLHRVLGSEIVQEIGSSNGTRCLMVDHAGGLWRGTRTGGIEHVVSTNVTVYAVSNGLAFNNVYSLAEDHAGAIWAGTEEGLNRIEKERISRFGRTDGLGHEFVSSLCVDSQGVVWAGTLGGGLSGWTGRRFRTITTHEGLADDAVQQLIEDDSGHLWIGTRAGLMRVALDELHRFLTGDIHTIHGTLVGKGEGLERPACWTEYQPANAKSRDGRLWFCTGSGLVLLDPRRFNTLETRPLAHIEEIALDAQPARQLPESSSAFSVPPRSKRIQIRFTGISPSAPELVHFRYRLDGYEKDWVEAGRQRVASYSRITPGRYQFEVMAVNNSGAWSEPATLTIQVRPAFWETLWFRGLFLTAFLTLGPCFYLWRIRKLELRRRQQEDFSRKLIESQEAERRRIAAELHDGLGQNLVLVKNLVQFPEAGADGGVGSARDIAAAANRALEEMHAISYALRPPELDRLGLAKALSAMVRRAEEASEIRFVTRIEFEAKLSGDCDIHLFRIAQEAVNNLVKHSGSKTARLEIWRDEGGVHLVVADEGCGMPYGNLDPGRAQIGLGLSGIEDRARLIGAQCHWISTAGRGTTLSVLIPQS